MSSCVSGQGPAAPEEPLRILLVEDAPDDAELILRELRRGGGACACQRVQSRADLERALRQFAPDIVLADHGLPQFNAFEALQLVRREQPRPL